MEIKENKISFKTITSNWIHEEDYSKRNTVRLITKKEQEEIQKSDLVWIKIISIGLDEFKNPKIISFRRKISNITFFEKRFLYFFKLKMVIFSW